MKPTTWKVKYTQKDNPSNTHDAIFYSQEDFEKSAWLHSLNFIVDVQTFIELPLDSFQYPNAPSTTEAPRIFGVKHYSSDEHPSLIGMQRYFHVIGDREEVQEFADLLNTALLGASKVKQ